MHACCLHCLACAIYHFPCSPAAGLIGRPFEWWLATRRCNRINNVENKKLVPFATSCVVWEDLDCRDCGTLVFLYYPLYQIDNIYIYIYIRLSPCFRNHGFGLRRNIFGANDYRIVFTGNMFYWMLVSLVISQSNFLKVLCIRNESPVAFLREAGIGRAAVAASWDPIGGILLPSLFPPRASMVVAHACKVLQLP